MTQWHGSFLEDPGGSSGASGWQQWESHPDVTEPAKADDQEIVGRGAAAEGMVRAVAGDDGRIRHLHFDPQLLQRGPRGTVMDSETLAAETANAVNAALDDLHHEIRQQSGDALGAL